MLTDKLCCPEVGQCVQARGTTNSERVLALIAESAQLTSKMLTLSMEALQDAEPTRSDSHDVALSERRLQTVQKYTAQRPPVVLSTDSCCLHKPGQPKWIGVQSHLAKRAISWLSYMASLSHSLKTSFWEAATLRSPTMRTCKCFQCNQAAACWGFLRVAASRCPAVRSVVLCLVI